VNEWMVVMREFWQVDSDALAWIETVNNYESLEVIVHSHPMMVTR